MRVLTYHYLLALNAGKLLWPSLANLCCDWSRGSIPLVEVSERGRERESQNVGECESQGV